MIRHVRKPNPRVYYDIAHHAASDLVLHGANLNPYRPGTLEYNVYESGYAAAADHLRSTPPPSATITQTPKTHASKGTL